MITKITLENFKSIKERVEIDIKLLLYSLVQTVQEKHRGSSIALFERGTKI